LCRINEYGEYMFTGRADFQIKHMGYRIELGEIETGLLTEEKVLSALALYDSKEDKIIMIYAGNLKEDKAAEIIKSKVPFYMIPNLIIRTTAMKYNNNGKIDRKWYSSNYQTLLKK
jgi:D-alanine--poly(phosphoribitol) ligase subunit 1